MLFLGIQLDSIKQTMEIDAERLKNIKAEIAHWMGKKYATLKQVQSIIGSLSFCASCAQSHFPYLCYKSMLQLRRNSQCITSS